jgi:RecA/RadA recombinase
LPGEHRRPAEKGRLVEIFGPESSGKTTLVYHVIAEAQRRGGIWAFIDAEHAMDPTYAKGIGVMFGNPETTLGGRALKFYSSVRLDIRRIETLKEGVERSATASA